MVLSHGVPTTIRNYQVIEDFHGHCKTSERVRQSSVMIEFVGSVSPQPSWHAKRGKVGGRPAKVPAVIFRQHHAGTNGIYLYEQPADTRRNREILLQHRHKGELQYVRVR